MPSYEPIEVKSAAATGHSPGSGGYFPEYDARTSVLYGCS